MGKKSLIIAIAVLAVAVIALVLALVFAVRGMSPAGQPTATLDSNAVLTAAAETANVRLTELALTTPSATPEPPTATSDPALTAAAQTQQVQLTQQALVTLTPAASPTLTAAPTSAGGVELAVYVDDITIIDGTDLAPGAAFTKTWRLKNAGATTWTTSYKLVFISGDRMGDVTSAAVPKNVLPNEMVDISVDLVAPTKAGTYTGYWKMLNAAGQFFNDAIYVQIDVVTEDGATAVPSPTSSGEDSGDVISNLVMVVDSASYTGTCPHTFTFSASFTVLKSATLTYGLEAGSETPDFEYVLPAPQTSAFAPGNYTLNFPLNFDGTASGWVRLHITAPVDVTSNQTLFSLVCE
jgi:hypothetical protein